MKIQVHIFTEMGVIGKKQNVIGIAEFSSHEITGKAKICGMFLKGLFQYGSIRC